MNDLALAILCVSFALGSFGVCCLALWTWRALSSWIVTTWSALLDNAARDL